MGTKLELEEYFQTLLKKITLLLQTVVTAISLVMERTECLSRTLNMSSSESGNIVQYAGKAD